MHQPIQFAVVFLAAYNTVSVFTYEQTGSDPNDSLKDISVNYRRSRSPRLILGAVTFLNSMRGSMAKKALLTGATRNLATSKKNIVQYTKPGNYDKALEDFMRVGPSNVHDYPLSGGGIGWGGIIGDRKIYVHNPPNGNPILGIVKHSNEISKWRVDRITYTGD